MREYDHFVEAAYIRSKRQGDMMRNRDFEQSTRSDRNNRYDEWNDRVQGSRRFHYGVEQGQPDSSQRNNRGKGPKNYKRPDERIQDDVYSVLSDHPEVDASDIEIEVKGCEVQLSGSVSSKHERRLAEDLCERVLGVMNVENCLRVGQQQEQKV